MKKRRGSKKRPTGDYKVGYARPPSANQFKPGQSGNPKGRARKAKQNMSELLKRELLATVTVAENGRPTELSNMEVFTKTLVRRAMTNSGAAKLLIELMEQAEVDAFAPAPLSFEEIRDVSKAAYMKARALKEKQRPEEEEEAQKKKQEADNGKKN